MLRRIRPDQVVPGMYIHGFEGSWFSHPFWRTGFLLAAPDDVSRIHDSGVRAVLIDTGRGLDLVMPPETAPAPPRNPAGRTAPLPSSPRLVITTPLGPPGPDRQDEDRWHATQVVANAKRVMRRVFDGARAGHAIRSDDVAMVVDDIVASLDRNRAMLIGIARLKSRHAYTYLHSVAVCTLMVNLSREIGLDDATVRLMGLAGLLHDVGKMAIDTAILDKPGPLTEAEFAELRLHTTLGHALLQAGEGVPDEALDVCLHHHERIDGSGYPFGLGGEAMSLAARLAAICDVYDAITSTRSYKAPWTPLAAITAMDGSTGHFDPLLLFRFMQSLDLYPVGMLVRLRSNRLAVVADGGPRATRAKLFAFYAIPERRFMPPRLVILSDTLAGDHVVGREDPAAWGFADWDAMRDRLLAAEPPLAMAAAGWPLRSVSPASPSRLPSRARRTAPPSRPAHDLRPSSAG